MRPDLGRRLPEPAGGVAPPAARVGRSPGGQITTLSSVTITATESMSMKLLSSGFTNSL